jgi:hypothetical protein
MNKKIDDYKINEKCIAYYLSERGYTFLERIIDENLHPKLVYTNDDNKEVRLTPEFVFDQLPHDNETLKSVLASIDEQIKNNENE